LGEQGRQAYEIALDAIGGPSYLDNNCKYELIPIGEPDVLSESTFYRDLFKTKKSCVCKKSFKIWQI